MFTYSLALLGYPNTEELSEWESQKTGPDEEGGELLTS